MKIEHTLVLELCRKEKNRQLIEEILSSANFNRDNFFRILYRHMVLPAAVEQLLHYSIPGPLKDYISAAAKKAVYGTTHRNNMIKIEFFRLRSALEDGGIECVLMKGLSLDFTGIRTIGDLDILVREKDLLAADRLARGAGYEYVGGVLNALIKNSEKHDIESQLHWNNQFQYINRENQLMLELHTNLFERDRAYIFDLAPLLDGIEIFWKNRTWSEGLGCHVFDTDDQLILMCLHTALKRSLYNNMFTLRNLTDIAAIIERRVDWEKVLARARVLKVQSFMLFALSLAVRLLGADVPGAVLDGLRAECTRGEKFLVSLHLRSFHNLETSWFFYAQLFIMLAPFIYQKKWLPRLKHLFLIPVIFPSRRKMSLIYNIQKDNPLIFFTYLLNPFRGIYLLVKRLMRLIF